MRTDHRRCRLAFSACFSLLLLACMSLPSWAAEKSRLRVDDYQIEAELNPHAHKISARAKVKFTALDDLSVATFELNNALRLTKVTDANNKPLSAERVVNELNQILPDGPRRQTMLEGLVGVKTLLRSPDLRDPRPAAERAADEIFRSQGTGDR